eukprot:COSAG04_NODE_356_length_16034_cov_11.195168_13_plen_79_part_00
MYLEETKVAFGEDYEEMKLVEEEEQEMKTINTVERLAKQKGISNDLQAEVTKIQIQQIKKWMHGAGVGEMGRDVFVIH